MMQESLLSQGLELLITGMGMVFVFLTLLVFCTRFMSSIVGRYFPEPEEPVVSKGPSNSSAPSGPAQIDKNILAAIQAAINEHRAKR